MAGAPGDELLRRQFSRRQFLKGAGGVAVGGTAALMGLDRFFLMSALAAPADPNDYKALVCVFLFGGNDANNMVIPSDEYGLYSAVRGGSQFAIPQDQLLGIRPRRDGRRFGLHPSMAKLQGLWAQDRMAVVANVGTLVEP
ncbi:MAG: twin-arginine translocation signal domain-containing protein, partial [Acidimicrobiales bacterium]